ncbi:hypothetical protein [Aequorivita capsosiphonis]|nr:hypothetical protein [Aequorivita capsosiphonis]
MKKDIKSGIFDAFSNFISGIKNTTATTIFNKMQPIKANPI